MLQVVNLLDRSEYAELAFLKGSKLKMFGGRGLHEWLSGAEVNVVTDRAALHIWVDIDELGQWEGTDGGEPDYTAIHVDRSDEGLAEAQEHGSMYFFHSGQTVTDVSIVRETVTQAAYGTEIWDYVTDVSIVFELSGGALAITKRNHSVEDLVVTHAESVSSLKIPPTNGFWCHWNDMAYSFAARREWLTIEEAMEIGV